MRWLAMVAILSAGCLDSLVPDHKSTTTNEAEMPDLSESAGEVDMAEPPTSNPDSDGGTVGTTTGGTTGGTTAGGTTTGGTTGGTTTGGTTGGTTAGGGALTFGQVCTQGSDCQSGLCEQINGGLLCTQACTMLGVADPTCPGGGMCNQKGYCKP